MDWRAFKHAQLYRLLVQLRQQQQLYFDVEAFAKQYSFPPDDPLRTENARAYRAVRDYIDAVEDMVAKLAPYRPLVDGDIRDLY